LFKLWNFFPHLSIKMSDSRRRKKSSKRAKKEEQEIIESINREQEEEEQEQEQEQEQEEEQPTQQTTNTPQYTSEQLGQFMQDPVINQKMLDMDIRIKYGFIKVLYNNLLSINSRFNWNPDELVAMGMVFRDLNNIEANVYNTVMQQQQQETEPIQEVEEEEEEPDEIA